jgi:hypothetical protein
VTNKDRRNAHAELVFRLAEGDQRLLDAVSQRPHLLNPYPKITTRLSRRSRKFRKKSEHEGACESSEPANLLYFADSPSVA